MLDEYTHDFEHHDALVEMLRGIYREHGWPDIEQYRKAECMEAVRRAIERRFEDLQLEKACQMLLYVENVLKADTIIEVLSCTCTAVA